MQKQRKMLHEAVATAANREKRVRELVERKRDVSRRNVQFGVVNECNTNDKGYFEIV